MDTVLQDLRFALRTLARTRGLTLAVILTLTLGVGATTAIFTVVHGIVLRPLPFADSEDVLIVCETHQRVGDYCVASPPNVEDWDEASRTIARFGVAREWPFKVGADGRSDGVRGGIATPGFFEVLRAQSAHGRLLLTRDLEPGRNRVAILSHGFWQRWFGGDPGVLGRQIDVDDQPATVVGVLAADTFIPMFGSVEIWMPLTATADNVDDRNWRGFVALGRLADGASLAGAREEMSLIRARLADAHPDTNSEWGLRVLRLRDRIAGSVQPTLWMFLGAVGFVLLIGCANVANLLLVRATGRTQEFALRASLGAGRARLVRQLLIESLLLSTAGALCGLGFATWATRAFLALAPGDIPRLSEVAIDGRVLLFVVGLSVAAAMLFGVVPALRASRIGLSGTLRGARHTDAGRLRAGLVVTEMALAVMLLVGAGLLGRGFGRLADWDPGFDRAHLVPVFIYTSTEKYPEGHQAVALFERVAEAVSAVPGIESVGLTSALPLVGGTERTEVTVDDLVGEPQTVRYYDVGPGYFATIGLPVLRGRDFSSSDRAGSLPVAMVNQTAANRFWPGRDPLGRRVTGEGQSMEVVGVVRDVPPFDPTTPAEPEIYWPKRQHPRWGTMVLMRLSAAAGALEAAVRDRVQQVDPDLTFGGFVPLDEVFRRNLIGPRFSGALVLLFAALALTLAAIGTYGVMAFAVASRTREIGIRMALGAHPRRILGAVIGRGMRLATIGVGAGVGAALLAGRGLSRLLYGVPPGDPLAIVGAAVVFLAVAFAACYVPARRAGRLDPVVALREE